MDQNLQKKSTVKKNHLKKRKITKQNKLNAGVNESLNKICYQQLNQYDVEAAKNYQSNEVQILEDVTISNTNKLQKLLLAYKYNIIDEFTHISIGFAPDKKFLPLASLTQYNSEIFFDYNQWKEFKKLSTNILFSFNNISETLLNQIEIPFSDSIKSLDNNNNTINVFFALDSFGVKNIILNQNQTRIELNKNQFNILIKLGYMIEVLLYSKSFITENIRQYYEQYIKKCRQLNIINLLNQEVLIPNFVNTTKTQWNFERMFFELPVVCEDMLMESSEIDNIINTFDNKYNFNEKY